MDNGLISRQAAIELKSEFLNPNVNRETEEQTAIDRAYARGWNSCNTHWIDEISKLPSAQPEIIYCKDINVPANDCISRQAAIDVIIEDKIDGDSLKIITAIGGGDKAETLNMTCDRHAKMLMDPPSVQPEIIRCNGVEYICQNVNSKARRVEADYGCILAERRTDE